MTSLIGGGSHSTFTSTTGGVMTEEAGALTGELELLCRPETGDLRVEVRYAGADRTSGSRFRAARFRSKVIPTMRWVESWGT